VRRGCFQTEYEGAVAERRLVLTLYADKQKQILFFPVFFLLSLERFEMRWMCR